MKKGTAIMAAVVLAVACMLVISGCTGQSSRSVPNQQKGVSDVIQERAQEEQGPQSGPSGTSASPDGSVSAESPASAVSSRKACETAEHTYEDSDVDVDLTSMGSDMVYATVYDMLVYPKSYEKRVVRMDGTFYHSYDQAHDEDYFYVIVQDATACCAQGLEFVWGDGTHAYPDDYPADMTQVVVTGVFQTYTQGTMNYIHLVDCDFALDA